MDNEKIITIIVWNNKPILIMETQKLTTDQFAIFMADVIKSVKFYNFDAFYDIAKIVKLKSEKQKDSVNPQKESFFLFSRDTGIDLIDVDNENLDLYIQNNLHQYLIEFCFNSDYFRDESFATIETIK